MSKLQTLFTPLMGAGMIEVVPQIELPTAESAQGIVGLVLQLVIGVVTLVKMLKKPKKQ